MPHAATRRALIRALAAAPLLVAAGCPVGTPEVTAERLPRFAPLATRPRLALVLGSGGPRGFAHIGVLKALEDEGVRPDLVVGCSVGAMVGAIYAAGLGARQIEQLAYGINVAEFFELGLIGLGKASGVATQKYVNAHVKNRAIEELGIGFAAAATRVRDRQLVLFTRGDTGLAVRASSANPESFEPVKIGDELFLDGDEASPVPIRAARSLGARFVVAVNVSAYLEDTPPGVPREWVEKDQRRARMIAAEAPEADVLLHPNIGYYAGHTDEYRRRVIAIAENYTRSFKVTARIPSGVASR